MEDSSTTDATLRLYRELRAAGRDETSASCCRPTCGGRSPTCRGSRTSGSARASTSSRPRSPTRIPTRSARASSPRSTRCSTRARTSGSRPTTSVLIARGARAGSPRAGSRRDEVRVPDAARRAPGRGDELVRAGHRLRVYVPFGTHWYEYSIRRLQENPKIAGYVAADTSQLPSAAVVAPEDAVAASVAAGGSLVSIRRSELSRPAAASSGYGSRIAVAAGATRSSRSLRSGIGGRSSPSVEGARSCSVRRRSQAEKPTVDDRGSGRGSSRRPASRETRPPPRRPRARPAGRPGSPCRRRSISSRFGKCSSAPVSTTPAETALTRIPRGASSTAR